MVFALDAEFLAAVAAIRGPNAASPPDSPVGDIASRRAGFQVFPQLLAMQFPKKASVTTTDVHTKSADGHEVLLRLYTKAGANTGSAALFLHPGGLILGDITMFDGIVQGIVDATGVTYVSVEYRLAPEHPYPKALEDAYAGLVWLHEHAGELNINPNRIAVHGESAGGGLAAALSIYVRDLKKQGGPKIAKQILVYPMLDDRVVTADAHVKPYLVWTTKDNETGWNAYLGSKRGAPDVPATASPARLADATGLPPMYLEVGELDLFRDESVAYAQKFWKAGVNVELHVLPGVPHGFEWMGTNTTVGSNAIAARRRAVSSIPK